jgi:hypothetical protein
MFLGQAVEKFRLIKATNLLAEAQLTRTALTPDVHLIIACEYRSVTSTAVDLEYSLPRQQLANAAALERAIDR